MIRWTWRLIGASPEDVVYWPSERLRAEAKDALIEAIENWLLCAAAHDNHFEIVSVPRDRTARIRDLYSAPGDSSKGGYATRLTSSVFAELWWPPHIEGAAPYRGSKRA
jgi:hypothetical protein